MFFEYCSMKRIKFGLNLMIIIRSKKSILAYLLIFDKLAKWIWFVCLSLKNRGRRTRSKANKKNQNLFNCPHECYFKVFNAGTSA